MREARFLFLLEGEFAETVLDSQVVDPLRAVRRHGIHFDLAVLMHGHPYFRRFARNRARSAAIAEQIGGTVRVYLTPRKLHPLGDRIGSIQLALEVARGRARRTVIHARGDMAGFYASRLRPGHDLRTVYDARGDVEAEYQYLAGERGVPASERERRLAVIRRHRAAAVRWADHILAVSTPLRDLLIERDHAEPAKITVVPCLADQDKFRLDEDERRVTRRELGLDDRFVVVFSGRLDRWHLAREIFAAGAELMRAFPDVHLLVLTPDLELAHRLAATLPPDRVDLRRAAHDEVPRRLRAADLALLLREDHPLNAVACPTKFAEYAMCGVPILISAGIGDCSRFVAEERAGIVLERPDPRAAVAAVEALRAEAAGPRRERIARAAGRFSRQLVAGAMADRYRLLARG